MNSVVATVLVVLLGLVPVTLLLFALARQVRTGVVLLALGTTVFAAVALEASPWTARVPAEAQRWVSNWSDSPEAVRTNEGQCAALLEASTTHGLLLDNSDPARPVVAASLWKQLPEYVRNVIEQCLRDTRRNRQGDFEVVER